MKFLWFGDMHERPEAPVNRIDNFRDSINEKIEEIKYLGKKYKVNAFLQPGDFLGEAKYSYEFLSEVIKRWSTVDVNELLIKLMTNEISANEVANSLKEATPIIGVIGNHELFGHSLKSFNKTSLKFLTETGFMTLATKENPVIFTTEDGLKIAITGSHYHSGMDKEENIHDYIVEEKLGDFHIHIVHGYLTNKGLGPLIRHTPIDMIADKTKADLTLAGHDHIGFGTIEVNGKHFSNIGSPVRLTNDLKEISRKPKVLLIDITKEHGIKLKEIPLKCAKDGATILDRTKTDNAKQQSAKMEEIKSLAQKANVNKGLNITEIVESIAVTKGIAEKLKEDIINGINDKIAKMTKPLINLEEYYITKIVLENFQSHESTILEISKGLNIFVGESCQGKSSILRALAWIFDNYGKNARRFIKKGKDFAKATIYLSNGYVISRVVEAKKTGKNGYEIYNPKTGEVEYNNTKYLPVVQEILGFNKLVLDSGKEGRKGSKREVPINFMMQGSSWYFIGDNYTSTDRANMMGSIYGTHYADAVIKDLEGDIKKVNSKLKDHNKELDKINKEIDNYKYLPKMKEVLDKAEKLQTEVVELIEKKQKVVSLISLREAIEVKINDRKKLIKSLESLEDTHIKLCFLKEDVKKRNEVEKLIKTKETIIRNGKEAKKVTEILKCLPQSNMVLEEIKKLHKDKEQMEKIYNEAIKLTFKKDSLLKTINFTENTINEIQEVSKAQVIVSDLKELIEKRKKAENFHNEAVRLNNEKNKISNYIKIIEIILDKTQEVSKAQAVLQELKKLVEKRNSIQVSLAKKEDITREGKIQNQIIRKAVEENRILVEEYKKALTKVGKCPVCHGTIDNAVISRLVEEYSMA
ncbi:TPA: metallophosphoesterase [Clostridium botulinum]|nr:metallophosphoesterase [Clostridium botulinum]